MKLLLIYFGIFFLMSSATFVLTLFGRANIGALVAIVEIVVLAIVAVIGIKNMKE